MTTSSAERNDTKKNTKKKSRPPMADEVNHNTTDAEGGTTESVEASVDKVEEAAGPEGRRGIKWTRVLAYGLLPGVALLLTLCAGYLKWADSSIRDSRIAQIESVRAATDSTITLLSYRPDSVEKDLGAASERLTGEFRDSYASLTRDVVIPGSKQKQISAVATVPAAASVSANEEHAVVLVFVDQTIIVGNDPPTSTASAVRVTLNKVDGHWLIARFDPI